MPMWNSASCVIGELSGWLSVSHCSTRLMWHVLVNLRRNGGSGWFSLVSSWHALGVPKSTVSWLWSASDVLSWLIFGIFWTTGKEHRWWVVSSVQRTGLANAVYRIISGNISLLVLLVLFLFLSLSTSRSSMYTLPFSCSQELVMPSWALHSRRLWPVMRCSWAALVRIIVASG